MLDDVQCAQALSFKHWSPVWQAQAQDCCGHPPGVQVVPPVSLMVMERIWSQQQLSVESVRYIKALVPKFRGCQRPVSAE